MGDKVDNEPAFILHTYPYRETSLIVEALSRGHGRVSLVARGARRPMSSLKSRLLAFQPLLLSWFGKGALRTLHASEWQGGGLCLRGQGLMCGFYMNELLLKLLPPDDPHEDLFERYVATLEALSDTAGHAPILRRFELGLLSELGYAQTLDHDVGGERVEASGQYAYLPGEGVVASGASRPTSLLRGKTLLDMARGDFSDPRTLAEGKQLMRALINHYLDNKPLMTRQLLLDLQSL